MTTHYSNFDSQRLVKLSNTFLTNSGNARIREFFGASHTVLSLRQPPNLLRLITKSVFAPESPTKNGIFRCRDIRCTICKLYLQQCDSFTVANGDVWEVKSHITCQSKNVIYYLKCLACDEATTYTGKTNNLRLRTNGHISGCRLGNSSDRFDNHVYACRKSKGINNEPFFILFVFVELPRENLLLTYEDHFHQRKFDTMN